MLNTQEIFSPSLSESDFQALSLRVFHHQYLQNVVYRDWVQHLKSDPDQVKTTRDIPFLPIQFFKSHEVVCSHPSPSGLVFTSSATTSNQVSRHFINDPEVYKQSFTLAFKRAYGAPSQYCILALLPNYLQRQGSSLVYMTEELIKQSGHPFSGFFLHDTKELVRRIRVLNGSPQKVILLGVSYALLDLCEEGLDLADNIIVMETGGMKGSRKEMMKEELHAKLRAGFNTQHIHSEYGMTELLSQAYSAGDSRFDPPPWMRFFIREIEDPLSIREDQRGGGINVVDLANIHSCSFIATQDLGRLTETGQLELLGRYDNSDIRGCNLMYESGL